jgi:hypothetical protein
MHDLKALAHIAMLAPVRIFRGAAVYMVFIEFLRQRMSRGAGEFGL